MIVKIPKTISLVKWLYCMTCNHNVGLNPAKITTTAIRMVIYTKSQFLDLCIAQSQLLNQCLYMYERDWLVPARCLYTLMGALLSSLVGTLSSKQTNKQMACRTWISPYSRPRTSEITCRRFTDSVHHQKNTTESSDTMSISPFDNCFMAQAQRD